MEKRLLSVVVLISGRGSNLEAIINHANSHNSSYRVSGVVSDREDALGLTIAKQNNLPIRVVKRRKTEISAECFTEELVTAIKELNPELVVLAGFMRILSPQFVKSFAGQIINIHPSLLPAFRGLNAQRQALLAGVKYSGCTVHEVNEDLDAGPILAQAVVPVLPGDSEDSLAGRILEREHSLYPKVIQAIGEGRIALGIPSHNGAVSEDKHHLDDQPQNLSFLQSL